MHSSTKAIALPKLYDNDGTNKYSDAHSQVLLSINHNAEALDKTQENQWYIRDACFLDMKAIDRMILPYIINCLKAKDFIPDLIDLDSIKVKKYPRLNNQGHNNHN